MNYLFHLFTMISIYVILVLSLNLVVGYAGLLSLSHAAFYGIGAYISTLLVMHLNVAFIPSLLLSAACAVLLSFCISIPSLKIKGDYFVLASLAFQIIVYSILYNWVEVTRGPYGISGIPRPRFMGFETNSIVSYFAITAIFTATCSTLIFMIGKSPFGRTLKSIREDELAAISLGKNVLRFKVITFSIAAAFAAIAGGLFACYFRFIDPTSFSLWESVYILSIIIIGGTGNYQGPLVGALLMTMLPEILRFIGLPDSIAANLRQILYGLLIILILRFYPRGLAGDYQFE